MLSKTISILSLLLQGSPEPTKETTTEEMNEENKVQDSISYLTAPEQTDEEQISHQQSDGERCPKI